MVSRFTASDALLLLSSREGSHIAKSDQQGNPVGSEITSDTQDFTPNTEVRITAPGVYQHYEGVIIKADESISQVCVDIYRLGFPVWCHKDELTIIGRVRPDLINRHIWSEIGNQL